MRKVHQQTLSALTGQNLSAQEAGVVIKHHAIARAFVMGVPVIVPGDQPWGAHDRPPPLVRFFMRDARVVRRT
jgi:hypothetical protein